jgi:DNA-binding NtrC family response regulator
MSKPKILIVDDDPSLAMTITMALESEGYEVTDTSSAEGAIEILNDGAFPIVISDIYMAEKTGLDVLHRAKALNPDGVVILMSGKGSIETVVEATRGGAFEYLSKPFSIDRLLEAVRSGETALQESHARVAEKAEPASAMVGHSAPMVELYKFIGKVAPTDATVLVRGETGCGKELVAQLLHRNSNRSKGRFVPVDCAALPGSLLESELFGVMKGAFTGADRDRVGLFEAAAGGTVFLDEIGEIDPGFQLRLLRFLQEKEVRPVGSTAARKVDVRVIAATNKDLLKLQREGKFREDLWYRLGAATIELPPLRNRRDDIPLLVEHFLGEFAGQYGRRLRCDAGAMKLLTEYSWPGNVRQLRHLVERLVILSSATVLDTVAVRAALPLETATAPPAEPAAPRAPESLSDAEDEHIKRVLAATGGNKTKAAEILGIERKTLYRKLGRM